MLEIFTAIFAATTCVAAVSNSAQSDACQACNCQFNNVQILDQLIQDKIAAALENNTGTKIMVAIGFLDTLKLRAVANEYCNRSRLA